MSNKPCNIFINNRSYEFINGEDERKLKNFFCLIIEKEVVQIIFTSYIAFMSSEIEFFPCNYQGHYRDFPSLLFLFHTVKGILRHYSNLVHSTK